MGLLLSVQDRLIEGQDTHRRTCNDAGIHARSHGLKVSRRVIGGDYVVALRSVMVAISSQWGGILAAGVPARGMSSSSMSD